MKADNFAVGSGAQFQADAAVPETLREFVVVVQSQTVANAIGMQMISCLPDGFGGFAFAGVNGDRQTFRKSGLKRCAIASG